MNMDKRSMPVCFTNEQYKKIEEIAKKKGMLNSSQGLEKLLSCLLYTSPSPRDATLSRMPSSA